MIRVLRHEHRRQNGRRERRQNVAVMPGEEGKPQNFSSAVVIEPGTYTVRLAAVDQKGHRASVASRSTRISSRRAR